MLVHDSTTDYFTQASTVIPNKHSQADTAVLDFAKTFDTVPHHILLGNLKCYNLNQQLIGWIESFLSSRTQRVVLDGCMSQEASLIKCPTRHHLRTILSYVHHQHNRRYVITCLHFC